MEAYAWQCWHADSTAVVHKLFRPKATNKIEGLRERTEHLDIFLFFCPSLNGDLLPVFCLLVEGECQILVFHNSCF